MTNNLVHIFAFPGKTYHKYAFNLTYFILISKLYDQIWEYKIHINS